ncbi:MAG: lipocalin family protein [Candidatus Pacebacteria bacterium]|nr:lipocalin family protein [Candidatus Paceibacterota bacterium]
MKTYKEEFIPIKFPQDEQKHDHIIEWWYFNGNLKANNGDDFFFMNCLFSAKTKKANIPFIKNLPLKNLCFSHYLLANKNDSKQRINPFCLIDKNNFQKPLLWINYDNGCLIEETEPFTYHIVNDFVDLKLKSTKNPLFLDKKGFIDLGIKTTYYYSLTRLETTGYVKIKTEWIEVKGLSWMDHQWAQTPLTSDDEWTWFSLQLDDGTDILCFIYGNKTKTCHASIINKKGQIVSTNNISIKAINSNKYISKLTKQTYNLHYSIEIPEYKISLQTSPVKTNQEMIFGAINYWEGGINIKGSIKNKSISGKGFMELLPPTKNKQILKAVIQEIKKNSLTENIKEMASISSKTIYSLSEDLKKKK